MALGDYPCGEGPCGFDPIATSTRTVPAPPIAIYFDLKTKQVLRDEDGYTLSMHPVDQEVALSLGVERSMLPNSPKTGLRVQRILHARSAALQSVALDEVRLALAAPLARNDIELLTVEVARERGRLYLAVDYLNRRTSERRTVSR